MNLQVNHFVFDSPPSSEGTGLKITAKCYTVGDSARNVAGLTLLFTHCIGSHKEQWEPTISRLFEIQEKKGVAHRLCEAWSFDWQSHGDAAVLNHEALSTQRGVSIYEWAPALTAFVQSPRMRGHRIVALGHSAGAGAIMLTTRVFPVSQIPYAAVLLIEPTIVTRELFNTHKDDRMAAMNFAVNATSVRRDKWVSRDAAFEWFGSRYPWNTWDPRVVRSLTEYGLQDTPSGVTLKCDRKQEAASYPDTEGYFESAILIRRVCHALPIHIIWGDGNDLVPEFIQESLSDESEGRVVASVSKVEGAGHMIVQEQPDRLAQTVCDVLDTIVPSPAFSKL
ncbi:Alpha/Beta hydrolase protein [Collybia nuda]|uniref:Alpha/Beta hydrolase protein n=1 Tax=Collybia nuda TaxID=64659 RepID=A0A9P5YD24_9AGAR|nr:Alpha/Beta hydrolase protein [Collybia nuda]